MEICFKVNGVDTGLDNEKLNQILQNQTQLMALIDDLKTQVSGLQTQVTDLQATIDAEQAQIQQLLDTNAQVVTDLNTQIATLQAQVAAGATPAQLQEVINSLTTVTDTLATSKTDLEGTVTPPPAP